MPSGSGRGPSAMNANSASIPGQALERPGKDFQRDSQRVVSLQHSAVLGAGDFRSNKVSRISGYLSGKTKGTV